MNPKFSTAPTSWALIEDMIRHASTQRSLNSNIAIGKELHKWGEDNKVTGTRRELRPIALSPSAGTVTYWHNIIIQMAGKLYVPFIDPRKDNCLASEGRGFVFSVQHTHIR
jgi:hypothetical protein